MTTQDPNAQELVDELAGDSIEEEPVRKNPLFLILSLIHN